MNYSLLFLSLYHTLVTSVGARAIFQAFQINNALQNFEMNGGDPYDNNSMQSLMQALKINTGLHRLYLSGNINGDSGANFLAQGLQINTNLRELDICCSQISFVGAQKLAQALQKNQRLQTLDICQNLFGDTGAEAFSQMLLINKSLLALRLGNFDSGNPTNNYGTGITDLGAQALSQALQYNFILISLDLRMNNISASNIEQINTLLVRNQQCAAETLLCPVLVNNQLTLAGNNATIVLTNSQFSVKTPAGTLLNNALLNITSLSRGQFLNNNQPVLGFTQSQVSNGQIVFQHDGSFLPPRFNVTTSIGNLTTFTLPAAINFTLTADQAATYSVIQLIEANQITSISLSDQGITDVDCQKIAEKLANNTIVTDVDLGGNPVGDLCVQALATILTTSSALISLKLYRTLISNIGVQAIFQALQTNPILQLLSCSIFTPTNTTLQMMVTTLQQNTNLQTLGFRYNDLNDITVSFFAHLLLVNTGLKTLLLDQTGITGVGAKKIADALKINKSLQTLSLFGNPIGDDGAQAFASMLLINHVLQALFLGYPTSSNDYSNNITNMGALALINGLQWNYVLQELNLATNPISNQTLITTINNLLVRNAQCAAETLLCPVLVHNQLTIAGNSATIVLTQAQFSVKTPTGTLLNNALLNITGLSHGQFLTNQQPVLGFTQSQVSNGQVVFQHDGSFLAPSFNVTASVGNLTAFTLPTTINFTLTSQQVYFYNVLIQVQNNRAATIDLDHANISDAQSVLLANALKNNTVVTAINFGANFMGPVGASALASMLQVNVVLRYLDLRSNLIEASGAIVIANALQVNKILQTFLFSSNGVSDAGANALANALQVNTVLNTMTIDNNQISFLGAQAIAQALQINHALQSLDISRNSILEDGAQAFLNTLQNNYVLTSLVMDSNSYTAQINALLARNAQCAIQTLLCPVLVNNQFTVTNGATVILTSNQLQVKTPTGTLLNAVFNITSLSHGQFLVNNAPVLSFTQSQVSIGKVTFQHDGSGVAPNFNVIASYGNLTTFTQAATVNFTAPISSTTVMSTLFTSSATPTTALSNTQATSSSSSSVSIAAVAGGIAGAVVLSAAAVWGYFRCKKTTLPVHPPIDAQPTFHVVNPLAMSGYSETDLDHHDYELPAYAGPQTPWGRDYDTLARPDTDGQGYAIPRAEVFGFDNPDRNAGKKHEYQEPSILQSKAAFFNAPGTRASLPVMQHAYEYADQHQQQGNVP